MKFVIFVVYFLKDLVYVILYFKIVLHFRIGRVPAENIAGSGLNLMHLYKIFQRNGEDVLRAIFTQKGEDGSPRVIKRVVDDVIPNLALYFENELSV